MAKRNARVTCKACHTVFAREEWLNETECSNPNCSCPKIVEARKLAQTAIDKASGRTTIEYSECEIPEKAYSDKETDECVFIDVPTVLKFKVIPITKAKR